MNSTTVVMTDGNGLLVNSRGESGESGRMKKLAGRMLGPNAQKAVLDYGWNGASKLEVSRGGQEGVEIALKAASTVVSGDLVVGGESIFDLLDQASAAALAGIRGTSGETEVYTEESDGGVRIGLSEAFVDRVTLLEGNVQYLIEHSAAHNVGDGLSLDASTNTLSAKLGTGLKFQDAQGSAGKAITLDMDSTPTQDSVKPVTSGGVYAAIQQGGGGGGSWGSITGDIEDQEDLQEALGQKADRSTTYTKTEVDTAVNAKYTKPEDGVPYSDLAEAVQSTLDEVAGKANQSTTYTKTEVDTALGGKLDATNPVLWGHLNFETTLKLLYNSASGNLATQGSGEDSPRDLAHIDELEYDAANDDTRPEGLAQSRSVSTYKVVAGTPLTITLPTVSASSDKVSNLDLFIDAVGVTTLPAITIQPATGGKVYAVNGTMPEIKADCITMIDATSVPGMNAWTIIGASDLKEVINA